MANIKLIPLQGVKSPQEIWDTPNAHLSELLENAFGVYSPWFDEINKHRVLNSKMNKKSKEFLEAEMQLLVAEKKLEFVQMEWYTELVELVTTQATLLGVQDVIDLGEVMDQLTDGRYMEQVYHRMSVQEYTVAVLRSYIEELSVMDLIVLNLVGCKV
jgi:hypothetical protein